LNSVVSAGSPDAQVRELVTQQESLQDFEVLGMVAPTMTVAELTAGDTSAFCRWPAALLATELDRNAFVSTIEPNLFEGDPDGWKTYVAHVRKRVAWFVRCLPKAESGARTRANTPTPLAH
jgi:hypothetical protein